MGFLGPVLGFVGSLIGGRGGSNVDALTQQREAQEAQRAHELKLAKAAERQQIIASARQRELAKTLLIGSGVLSLGAVGVAVVVKA